MQTKHLCVLVHIWTKSEVGALWNRLKPSIKIFYWPFQGSASFVDHLCYFCLVFVSLSSASIYWCLVVTCWERAGLLAFVCDVFLWSCHYPLVSRVRFGAWLYRFLIYALFITLIYRLSESSLSSQSFVRCFATHLYCHYYTRNDQTVLANLYFGLPGNENLTISFQYNLASRQCSSFVIPSK